MMLDLSSEQGSRIDRRLREATVAWLSTVRPDGGPHLVPVWFLWDNETILIFSMPKNQKLRNLRQNNRVVLGIPSGGGASNIVVEGQAELLGAGVATTTLPAYAAKYGNLITGIGLDPASMARRYSQAIRVTPAKIVES
jgi:PPOX class probable F420-dependent enzyme